MSLKQFLYIILYYSNFIVGDSIYKKIDFSPEAPLFEKMIELSTMKIKEENKGFYHYPLAAYYKIDNGAYYNFIILFYDISQIHFYIYETEIFVKDINSEFELKSQIQIQPQGKVSIYSNQFLEINKKIRIYLYANSNLSLTHIDSIDKYENISKGGDYNIYLASLRCNGLNNYRQIFLSKNNNSFGVELEFYG